MKWSSIAAALILLAVSAPVHADLFSRYQRVAEVPAMEEGPEISISAPQEQSVYKAATPSEQHAVQSADVVESADVPVAEMPAASMYDGGYGAAPPYAANYGSAASCGCRGGCRGYDDGSAHCCDYVNPKAMHVWDGYCESKHRCLPIGWLVRKHCCCCPMPAPRPIFSHACCKPHFQWTSFRAPVADCDTCGAAPCKCGKPGLFAKLFGWMHAHHAGCAADDCSDAAANQWSEGGEYESEIDASEMQLPAPPEATEEATESAPAAAPNAKSAHRGLLPEAFRLFPIGR
ncbi:MAG: hypothetical protein RIC55_24210 [Pirellulaceae bacterium]